MMSYSALKDRKPIPSLNAQASQEIANFYANMKSSPGPHLGALHSRVLADASNNDYVQILKDIAKEQRFEITYVYIPELSRSGELLLNLGFGCGFFMHVLVGGNWYNYIRFLVKHIQIQIDITTTLLELQKNAKWLHIYFKCEFILPYNECSDDNKKLGEIVI